MSIPGPNATDEQLLAGVSVMTAMRMKWGHQDDALEYKAGGPDPDGKFSGWICQKGEHWPMVSTQCMFPSADDAVAHVKRLPAAAARFLDANYPTT